MAKREWLIRLRKRAGLSQAKLAAAVGTGRETVYRWENGLQDFYDRHRPLMAEALGISVEALDQYETAYQLASADEPASSVTVISGVDSPQSLERILATSTVTDSAMAELNDTVLRRAVECVGAPPEQMQRLLFLDLGEVQRFVAERQPLATQRKLTSLLAQLAALLGVEMMVLQHISGSRAWYRLAMTAAVEAEDPLLAARVGALRATLPLYYGDPAEGVRLAREAREDVADELDAAAALAPCLEGVGLAQLGEITESRRCLTAARRVFDSLPEDERAATVFGFAERRLAFYESRALSESARREPDRRLLDEAFQAQERALDLYRQEDISVGDPTLILLDRAGCLARAGKATAARDLTEETLGELPPEHRSPLFVHHLESAQLSSR